MRRRLGLLLAVALLVVFAFAAVAQASPPGAIFTTLVDGTRVNANIYDAKEDVYLDGGPGPNAPQGAAGLPDGDYYFQVTDPSGKVLLSVDPIGSRMVQVLDGIIVKVYDAPTLTKYRGVWYGTHATGTDVDHGALTVQLMPYADTPNNGGVYKAWMTPVDKYSPGEGFHGFIPAWSKTDNYKVKGKRYVPPITVRKFHDLDADGVWDEGEPELHWAVNVTDPLGVENLRYTPFVEWALPYGLWTFTEATPEHWQQTAAYLDGAPVVPLSPIVIVPVFGYNGETHEVVYGNVQLGCAQADKFYDANANGVKDDNELEVPIAGVMFTLTGTAVNGTPVGPLVAYTGEDGVARWCDLLPGEYVITETLPSGNWSPTTPVSATVTVVGGETAGAVFGNICWRWADFNTKGFWHNKNGLDILAVHPEWIAYANGLAPYADDPFDGLDENGNPVPEAQGPAGETIAAAGTPLAEISHFLVDSNSDYQQLEQQLLAFIFNVKANDAGAIEAPGGGWVDAYALIADAIAAWESGSGVVHWAGVLDAYNNDDSVMVVKLTPCPVVYQ